MKFFLLPFILLVGASAQIVSFVSPPFDSTVTAGEPFNVTMFFDNSGINPVQLVALFFGLQPGGDPSNQVLGTELKTVFRPKFAGPNSTQVVTLTVPNDVSGLVNVTCGIFNTVGISNIPSVSVTKTRFNFVQGYST